MIFEAIAVIFYSLVGGFIYAKNETLTKFCNTSYDSDSEDDPDFQDLSRIVMNESTFPHDFSSIHERNIY